MIVLWASNAPAGLSAGAVYRYVRSKEEISGATVEVALGTADDVVAGPLADNATPALVYRMMTMVESLLIHPVIGPGTDRKVTRIAVQVWRKRCTDPI